METKSETCVIWGFVFYSAQLPFFLGVFPGKEGRMNLKVSKSHCRCVETRQLVPKHQLTFLSIHQHCMACTTSGTEPGLCLYLHSCLLPSEHRVELNVWSRTVGMSYHWHISSPPYN